MFAWMMLGAFELPSIDPKANRVSYSGIFPRTPPYTGTSAGTANCLPHATGHLRQVVSRSW